MHKLINIIKYKNEVSYLYIIQTSHILLKFVTVPKLLQCHNRVYSSNITNLYKIEVLFSEHSVILFNALNRQE